MVSHQRLALLVILLSVCCPGLRAATVDDLLVPIEKGIGHLVATDLENTFGLCTDPQMNSRVNAIGSRLCSCEYAKRDGLDYRFRVLDSSEINAFAAPGGFVYVTTGLLRNFGPADDEIAFVLAHEIAHVRERHGLKQIGLKGLIRAVTGKGGGLSLGDVLDGLKLPNPWGDKSKSDVDLKQVEAESATKLCKALLTSGISRGDERSADEKGVQLALQAGYDAAGSVAAMRRLETISEKDPGVIKRLFATHDPTSKRAETIKDALVVSVTGYDYRKNFPRLAKGDGQSVRRGRPRVLLHSGPTHLGDDDAQAKVVWFKEFELTEADVKGTDKPAIELWVKGVEKKDPIISINRHEVGRAVVETSEWQYFRYELNRKLLRPGKNLLDLETFIPHLWDTFDECEFKNVRLLLGDHQANAGQWYRGIVHVHTTFSDGAWSPETLAGRFREHGADFMIVTDHYNQIGKAEKGLTPLSALEWAVLTPAARFLADGPFGFDNYHRLISGLTHEGEFVAIPGAEIAATWSDGTGNEAEAHTLAIGSIGSADDMMLAYDGKADMQQLIIARIRHWGLLPVAAHPNYLRQHPRIDYRFDRRPADPVANVDGRRRDIQYRGLAGIEMWKADGKWYEESGLGGEEDGKRYEEDVDFYLDLIRDGFGPFVTSGRDLHVGRDLMSRVTGVYANELTAAAIQHAIAEGRTYAAQHGARLDSLELVSGESETSLVPGDHVQADTATIRATVKFDEKTSSGKQFMIYRDGCETPMQDPFPSGRDSYKYEWTDPHPDGKEHSYVLRVSEVLITSPIYITAESPR